MVNDEPEIFLKEAVVA